MDSPTMALNFDGMNALVTLTRPLPAMPNGITVEFWAFGADDLPRDTSVFHASIAPDHTDVSRALNIHLPWSNEAIYWDAGNDGPGYDRIDKMAVAAGYKGRWRHWAFVKDVAKGEMSIYFEGILWHQGSGKAKPIPACPYATIGSNHGGLHRWSGRLAEFRIWDEARTVEAILADKDRRLTGQEPGLVGYWPLDRVDAEGLTPDLAGDRPGKAQGVSVVPGGPTLAAPPEIPEDSSPIVHDDPKLQDRISDGIAAATVKAMTVGELQGVAHQAGYGLAYGFINGMVDGARAASTKPGPPKADAPPAHAIPPHRDADAIKVRPNTGVPASFLQRDLLVCCGEDREEMLHAVRAVLPDDVPSHRYRCYEFWRYPSFSLVLTGIGTGCLEPMLWEVMNVEALGDKAARRLVLFGTAGYLSSDKSGCGKVFLVEGAYPAGCAVRLDPADLPVRPRFKGLDKLPNPRAEEISTDHFYAFSPSTDAHKMVAKKYDKSLQEGVTAQWKDNRLIAMETGQFYHFCRCYGDDGTQFAAFRGVANLADQFEQQGENAVNVLTESFRQAVQLLRTWRE